MPSWNIHIAHAERLLSDCGHRALGIDDANAFLFGNFVPDIYLGFMVPDVSFRIDYCLTHMATVATIPIPDSDRFWDNYIYRRRPISPERLSLTIGAWAHLMADNVYNTRFRDFAKAPGMPVGDELRERKQADFDAFGKALGISTCVRITPELLEAADRFRAYRISADDAERAVRVANEIVRESEASKAPSEYQLLSEEWMEETFDACDKALFVWLATWQRLEAEGRPASAADIQAEKP